MNDTLCKETGWTICGSNTSTEAMRLSRPTIVCSDNNFLHFFLRTLPGNPEEVVAPKSPGNNHGNGNSKNLQAENQWGYKIHNLRTAHFTQLSYVTRLTPYSPPESSRFMIHGCRALETIVKDYCKGIAHNRCTLYNNTHIYIHTYMLDALNPLRQLSTTNINPRMVISNLS